MTDLPAQQGNLLNTNFIRLDVEKVRGYYATRRRSRRKHKPIKTLFCAKSWNYCSLYFAKSALVEKRFPTKQVLLPGQKMSGFQKRKR